MIRRTYTGSISALGNREIVARASDENVGRDGLRLVTAGIELGPYRQNPVVLFGHDPSRPVGRCSSIRATGAELIARIEFAPAGASELADQTCSLCKAGVLSALSIGFNPVEVEPRRNGVQTITRSELLEVSIVAVPALPSAMILERSLIHRRGARAPLSFAARQRQVEVMSPALRSAAVARLMPRPPIWRGGSLARWTAEKREFIELDALARCGLLPRAPLRAAFRHRQRELAALTR
jgi:HK97 family phage prohead protease